MYKKLLSIAIILSMIFVLTGCGNKTINTTVSSDKTKPTGDTSVPKTQNMYNPNDLIQQFENEQDAEEAIEEKFQFQKLYGKKIVFPSSIEGYDYKKIYFVYDVAGCIYYNQDGNAITIKVSDSDFSSEFKVVYDEVINNVNIEIGSRLGKDSVGNAIWEDDGIFYMIETTPYEEISVDELKSIVIECSDEDIENNDTSAMESDEEDNKSDENNTIEPGKEKTR